MFTVIPKDGIKYQNDTLNDIESNLTVKKLKKIKSILENFHLIASNRFSPIFYACTSYSPCFLTARDDFF